MRLTRADLKTVDMSQLVRLAPEPSTFDRAGEHYRLLAYLSSLYKGQTIVDLGTHHGSSAIALSYEPSNRIESFDIEDHVSKRVMPANVRFHRENLYDPAVREQHKKMLLESALIFVDTDPHSGIPEHEFLRWLQKNEYRGLIVLDDVWYFKPMRDNLWYRIEGQHRTDVTPLGHWSGTGLVSFGGERVQFEDADLSNWTLVTAYFDLTKQPDASPEVKARPAGHYLDQHASSTLALDKNLVVFCEPENEAKVWAMRPKHLHPRTRVLTMAFDHFPMTKHRAAIIANRGGNWCPTDHRNTASYYLFCMARYAMLKQVIGANPFKSTHFGWINICIERMGFQNLLHLDEALAVQRDRFSTCFIDYVPRDVVNNLAGYFHGKACVGRCSMCSGFFTGNAKYMTDFCNRIEGEFLRCLKAGVGHADEQLYPLVYFKDPGLFDWYLGDYSEMITNYAHVYARPEQPVRNLIRNSLAAGDREVCTRACGILLTAHNTGRCSLSQSDLDELKRVMGALAAAPA
jgi:hypothetical protein